MSVTNIPTRSSSDANSAADIKDSYGYDSDGCCGSGNTGNRNRSYYSSWRWGGFLK
jgi:hypothetical protein